MFTEKQITKLLDTHQIHPPLYEWVRKHVLDRQYASLTAVQRKTLHSILEMPKADQKKYIIIKDALVEAPTKVQNYAKTQGKWTKRDSVRLQYNRRKL